MKQIITLLALFCLCTTTLVLGPSLVRAQQASMQYFRPLDKYGLNVFETPKADTTVYTGLHVRFGGAFAQDYQALSHSNTASYARVSKTDSTNANLLANLTSGFNLAMANFTIDAQLENGVRANVTMYLSSKHHNEAWVKNGYLQLDRLSFLHLDPLDALMNDVTLKVGDLEVDYGDQHYRRTDGGNEMYNPFVENYIMDEFATEIGGEVLYHPANGVIAMFGVTDGMLNPTVVASNKIDSVSKSPNSYNPAFHGKLGYEMKLGEEMRFRLTGSFYQESSTSSSTLFGGDRTGSHYYLVGENTLATTTGNAFSGRFNPGFSDEVTTFMINPFIKVGGLEFFGTYEQAKGRTVSEVNKRTATQLAGDLVFRFGANDNFWVGGRYNNVKATLPGSLLDVTVNRIVASAGWFLTPNVMMKAEYVSQDYKDFAPTDIRNGLKFNGAVIEAALGF